MIKRKTQSISAGKWELAAVAHFVLRSERIPISFDPTSRFGTGLLEESEPFTTAELLFLKPKHDISTPPLRLLTRAASLLLPDAFLFVRAAQPVPPGAFLVIRTQTERPASSRRQQIEVRTDEAAALARYSLAQCVASGYIARRWL